MPAGVSSTGLQIKTFEELFSEMEAELLSNVDPEIDTSEDAAIGQILRNAAKKLAEVWELLDTAYGAFDESNAQGSLLEAVAGLTGTYREAATKGRVTINCVLAAGTSLTPLHAVRHVTDETSVWHPVAGITAAITGTVPVLFECERTGVVEAAAGTLAVIVTPVAGWSSATNPLDAEPGRAQETIEELRIRRREELRAQGGCTLAATHADVLLVEGVRSVAVFENDTSVTVGTLPPHSFEVVIWDGVTLDADDADIFAAVRASKPSGIQAVGSITTTLTDEVTGQPINLAFSRVTQVPITVDLTLAIDAATFPLDGVAQVKAAVAKYGDALKAGNDVFRLGVMAKALTIPGVKDVNACTLNGGTSNIAIGQRQIATFDTSAVFVSTVAAAV